MDEDKKIEQANIELKKKDVIADQLESFINDGKKTEGGEMPLTYYPGLEDNNANKKEEPKNEPAPAPLISLENMPLPEPQKQIKPIIRTYKSDIEETVQNNHLSSINIAVAENKKMLSQAQLKENDEKRARFNKNILVASIVLVLAGVLLFFIPKIIVQMQYSEKAAPVETVSSKPIITADVEEKVNINDINLNRVATTLRERIDQSSIKLGQVKNIYLTEGTGTAEKLITSTRFLELIRSSIPSDIQRTIKTPYMFGSYNYNGTQKFVILKVGSYDLAFSGMFSWESSLWQDFQELFGLQMDTPIGTTISPSATKKFQDAVFNNKDCRVIKNSAGDIIFLYSIIDENTIVITTSTDALRELINRVSKAKIVTQ